MIKNKIIIYHTYVLEERCYQPTWNLVKYHPTKSGIEQASSKWNTKRLITAGEVHRFCNDNTSNRTIMNYFPTDGNFQNKAKYIVST